MKTIIEKVYHCQYCKKYSLSAGSMSRHEKYCPSKPENRHKCFDMCRFLKRERMVSTKGVITEFTCEKKGQKMYSYLAEKKQTSYFGNPLKVDGLVRMPIECSDHDYMTESQYAKRFGTSSYFDE